MRLRPWGDDGVRCKSARGRGVLLRAAGHERLFTGPSSEGFGRSGDEDDEVLHEALREVGFGERPHAPGAVVHEAAARARARLDVVEGGHEHVCAAAPEGGSPNMVST